MNNDIIIDILKWDSHFFGCNVGRIRNAPRDVDRMSIHSAMQKRDLQLLYWFSPKQLSASLESFYVVTQVTYQQLLNQIKPEHLFSSYVNVYPYPYQVATEELRLLAYEAGWSSRFKIDSHFSASQFRMMYDQWIDRSCRREIADIVLVSMYANSLAGFITLKTKDDSLQIGLIAVAKEFRGKGIGQLLIENAKNYAKEKGCQQIKVVTQINNLGAIKLYGKMGLQLVSTQHCYHFWSHDIVA